MIDPLPLPTRSRLLIVDDQPVNVQALFQSLAGEHQILVATNGAKALELCRQRLPDLVVLDVEMPDISGHEVCARLKADPATRDIPIIFVTGRSSAEDEAHVFSLGAVDFIAKPINPAVVRARVKTHLTLKHQSDLLRRMATIDGLTGIHNRRHLDQQLAQEWLRAARGGTPLGLVLADIDHFKAYNDRYGHQAGDDCLRQVAQALKASLVRPGDFVARYGGEEFACVLPETDLAGAGAVAARLEQTVRALGLPHHGSARHGIVTVSLGAASALTPDMSGPEALINQADQALYAAKAAGRGRAFAGLHEVQLPATMPAPI